MDISDIAQTPLKAFYASDLLAWTKPTDIADPTILKLKTLRKFGYYADIYNSKTMVVSQSNVFAIPILWSPYYPPDFHLLDPITLTVEWMATVNTTNCLITNPVCAYQFPYNVRGTSVWDVGSLCVYNGDYYTNWYDVDVLDYNGVHHYNYGDLTKLLYVGSNSYIFKNPFEDEEGEVWYQDAIPYYMWTDYYRKKSSVTVTKGDLKIVPYQALTSPLAKITESLWIFKFCVFDGFYVYNPNHLETFVYDGLRGYSGSATYYLHYFENGIVIGGTQYIGWIMSPYDNPVGQTWHDQFYYHNPNADPKVQTFTKYYIINNSTITEISTTTLAHMPSTQTAYIVGADSFQ